MPGAPGTLYVVATPIGNLADASERAKATIAGADFVAAEDTRHTAHMLGRLGIRRPLVSLHEHNEAGRTPGLVARMAAGESCALVSDAGTPLVSDPGFRLVRAAQDAGIPVRAVPGPCAAVAALSVAGLATDRFAFEGFLPARAPARRKRLGALADEARTLVFYEAPHRLAPMLADCARAFGAGREAALARELTKLHETVRRAPLGELAALVERGEEPARGECVVLVAGAEADRRDYALDPLLEALLAEGVAPTAAAAALRRASGRPRAEIYARAVELSHRIRRRR